MKKSLAIILAAATIGLALPAQAFHCPADMHKIDAALAQKPKISKPDMAKAISLRAQGEAEHKSGQHGQSVNTLAEAMKLLGIN